MPKGVDFLIFGEYKLGKSFLGSTAPKPIVVIDVEDGSSFTPVRHVVWDPRNTPPQYDGTWDVAIVHAKTFNDVKLVQQWLTSGRHPFQSAVLDSISRIQQLAIEEIANGRKMEQQDWGELLRQFTNMINELKNLKTHPTKPLDSLVVIAMAKEGHNGKLRPLVQGQLSEFLPYMFDVVACLDLAVNEHGEAVRRLYVDPHPNYVTGQRVAGALGPWVDNASIEKMVQTVREYLDRVNQQQHS
jgi:hypothetical protein